MSEPTKLQWDVLREVYISDRVRQDTNSRHLITELDGRSLRALTHGVPQLVETLSIRLDGEEVPVLALTEEGTRLAETRFKNSGDVAVAEAKYREACADYEKGNRLFIQSSIRARLRYLLSEEQAITVRYRDGWAVDYQGTRLIGWSYTPAGHSISVGKVLRTYEDLNHIYRYIMELWKAKLYLDQEVQNAPKLSVFMKGL